MSMRLDRYEVMSMLARLGIACGVSYLTVKLMMDLLDPTRKQKKAAESKAKELLGKLGIDKDLHLDEHEMMIASQLVEPKRLGTNWDDIGGLNDTIKELQETVILPLQNRFLYRHSKLLQPPKGIEDLLLNHQNVATIRKNLFQISCVYLTEVTKPNTCTVSLAYIALHETLLEVQNI
jgi:hypothetical protein